MTPNLTIKKVGKWFEIQDDQEQPTVYGRYTDKAAAEEALEGWNNYYGEEE